MSDLTEALDVITNYVYGKDGETVTKNDWHKISTAPKDGRHLLITWESTWDSSPHIEVCAFENGSWYYVYDGDVITSEPTHWMPLPHKP